MPRVGIPGAMYLDHEPKLKRGRYEIRTVHLDTDNTLDRCVCPQLLNSTIYKD